MNLASTTRALLLICLAFLLPIVTSINASDATGETPSFESEELHAVSLRALQNQLIEHHGAGELPSDLADLGGMRVLWGYVIDRPNRDLILWGTSDSDRPALHLEDLAIALRNAWMRYASRQGNTYMYSSPGCSIDPNPQTMAALDKIKNKLGPQGDSEQVDANWEEWQEVCEQPQSVRVLGIPFHTRFAQVMVKADYDMKELADGSDSLGIAGFRSVTDIKLDEIKAAVHANKPVQVSMGGLNRFWFYPGNNHYLEQDGKVMLEMCPVTLLTEESYLASSGRYTSAGRIDPAAQEFSQAFTLLYDLVAEKRPVYRELENLFRFVALAQIIKFKSAHEQAGLSLDYLLDSFPISEHQVAESLAGRAAAKKFQHREVTETAVYSTAFWLPSCGGVTIDLQAGASDFRQDDSGTLDGISKRVLNARPSPNSAHWIAQPASVAAQPARAKSLANAQKINRSNRYFSFLTVEKTPKGYIVLGSKQDPIYEGSSLQSMADAVNQQMGEGLKSVLYLDMPNFNSKEIEGFVSTFRIHQARTRAGIETKPLLANRDLQNAITSTQVQLISHSGITVAEVRDQSGETAYKGAAKFVARIGRRLQQLTVQVYARSRRAVETFFQRFFKRTEPSGSLLDDAIRIRQELKKEFDLKDEDIDIRFHDEYGQIEIVIRTAPVAG